MKLGLGRTRAAMTLCGSYWRFARLLAVTVRVRLTGAPELQRTSSWKPHLERESAHRTAHRRVKLRAFQRRPTPIIGGIVVASALDHDSEGEYGVSSLPHLHRADGGKQLDRGVVFVHPLYTTLRTLRYCPGWRFA